MFINDIIATMFINDIIAVVIVADLFLNFFFHLLSLKRYCYHEDVLHLLNNRNRILEHKLISVNRKIAELSVRTDQSVQGSQEQKEIDEGFYDIQVDGSNGNN